LLKASNKFMSGARLAILYGYVPCQLGLCGPEDTKKRKIISRYLKGEKKLESEIKKILIEFKGAYPYYQLIASSNKIKNPLDYKVVEAYWVGNKLLEKVKISDFREMILKDFVTLGKVSKKKVDNLPQKALAYHSFHVLHLGSVTGRTKLVGKALDFCRPSWGEVVKIHGDKNLLTIRYKPLKIGKKTVLGKLALKEIKWNKDILSKIKTGEWVSMHWNTAIDRLTPSRVKNIEKYTQKTLESLHS
jgi:hypothetical protein